MPAPLRPFDPNNLARFHFKRHILQRPEPFHCQILVEDFHWRALRELTIASRKRMIRLLEVSQVCIAYFKWLALMAMFLEDIRGGRFIRTDDELKFHLYTGLGIGSSIFSAIPQTDLPGLLRCTFYRHLIFPRGKNGSVMPPFPVHRYR